MESFTERLIPNLSSNSVAVLDITKYHNSVVEKIPAKSSTKMAMLEDGRPRHPTRQQNAEGIPLHDDESQKCHTLYVTHIIAENHEHVVLRLPVGHCKLYPIMLV